MWSKKLKQNKKYLLFLLATLIAFAPAQKKKIKVWMIGDSTMCPYEPARSPLTGWGMPFGGFFDSTVAIKNMAKGGRSTRTFISENRWQPIADSLQEGDYVLIQFGHNDEAKEEKYKDRYTSPEDYRINLNKFIAETRAKNANPILITPVSRRYFDRDGKIKETHQIYSDIVRDVAKQQNVPVIDLDEMSRALFQKYGAEDSRLFFNQIEPNVNPHYPEGIKDDTHFNEMGARRLAEMVLGEIKKQQLELADRIVKVEMKK